MTTILEHGLRVGLGLPGTIGVGAAAIVGYDRRKIGTTWMLVNRPSLSLVRHLPGGITAMVDRWDPSWTVITKSHDLYEGPAETVDEGMVAADAWLVANRHIEPAQAASPLDSGWAGLVGFVKGNEGPDAWVRIVRFGGVERLITVTADGWMVTVPAVWIGSGQVGGEEGKSAVDALLRDLRSKLGG